MQNQKMQVSEIVRGMNNILRMRREITTVSSGLLGRLEKLGILPKIPTKKTERRDLMDRLFGSGLDQAYFSNGTVRWKLLILGNNYALIFEAKKAFVADNRPVWITLFCSEWKDGANGIHFADVEIVHDGLQVLVDSFLETYGKLCDDAPVIRRAAAKFPESRG